MGRSLTADRVGQHKRAFLDAYALSGVILTSAAAVGISRQSVYQWLDADPDFKQDFEEAGQRSLDAWESELHRRGVTGWDDPVYQGGELVGHIRKYSDACLIFGLKARAPAKYRDNYAPSVSVNVSLTTDALLGAVLALRVDPRLIEGEATDVTEEPHNA